MLTEPKSLSEVQEYVKDTLTAFIKKIGSRITHLETEIKKLNLELVKLSKLEERITVLESINSAKKTPVKAAFPAKKPLHEPISIISDTKEVSIKKIPSVVAPAPQAALKTAIAAGKEANQPEKKEKEKDELLKALKVIESL
jgi:hypothetical protein